MSDLFDHIAVCIDESEGSRRALAEARRLRALGGPGRLTLLHVTGYPLLLGEDESGATVVDPRDPEVAARRWLAAQAGEGEETVLLHGAVTPAVVRWAGEATPDLLVVGAVRNALQRLMLGSVASALAHEAPCPVLMVRPGERAA
ncbi:MAG: universal stress protein [Thermoleophilia bacterium]